MARTLFGRTLPTIGEIHLEAANGHGYTIAWEKVDPILLDCFEPGHLSTLSKYLSIPHGTLSNRRKELGLDPLPIGRPPEFALTPWEQKVIAERDEGKTLAEIGAERGVTHVAVRNAEVRGREKTARQCPKCLGVGVIKCGLPNGDERDGLGGFSSRRCCDSSHLCEECGGTGRAP